MGESLQLVVSILDDKNYVPDTAAIDVSAKLLMVTSNEMVAA